MAPANVTTGVQTCHSQVLACVEKNENENSILTANRSHYIMPGYQADPQWRYSKRIPDTYKVFDILSVVDISAFVILPLHKLLVMNM
jgi:hypothetical protein